MHVPLNLDLMLAISLLILFSSNSRTRPNRDEFSAQGTHQYTNTHDTYIFLYRLQGDNQRSISTGTHTHK